MGGSKSFLFYGMDVEALFVRFLCRKTRKTNAWFQNLNKREEEMISLWDLQNQTTWNARVQNLIADTTLMSNAGWYQGSLKHRTCYVIQQMPWAFVHLNSQPTT